MAMNAWLCDPTRKIVPSAATESSITTVKGAKNEQVGVQVIIQATAEDLAGVQVVASDFTSGGNTIPASGFMIYKEGYVNCDNSSADFASPTTYPEGTTGVDPSAPVNGEYPEILYPKVDSHFSVTRNAFPIALNRYSDVYRKFLLGTTNSISGYRDSWYYAPAGRSLTNAVNNGSSKARITLASHGFATGQKVFVEGATGTSLAGVNTTLIPYGVEITVIDANTFDLDGAGSNLQAAFAGTWTSGGTVYAGISSGRISVSGTYSGGGNKIYLIQITTAGSPGTAVFKWSDDNGSNYTTGVSTINGSAVSLNNGLSVTFTAGPFQVGESYVFYANENRNQPVWIDLNVPSTAVAGTYTGTITVSATSKSDIVLSLTLTVHNFSIPSTATLKSHWGLGIGNAYLPFNNWVTGSGAQYLGMSKLYAKEALRHYMTCGTNSGGVIAYTWNADDTVATSNFTNWESYASDMVTGTSTFPSGAQWTTTPINWDYFQTSGTGWITGTDGNSYLCIQSHTADSTNRPVTGANWADYWVLNYPFNIGSAWSNGASYIGGINRATNSALAHYNRCVSNGSDWSSKLYDYVLDEPGTSAEATYGAKRIDAQVATAIGNNIKYLVTGRAPSSSYTALSPFVGKITRWCPPMTNLQCQRCNTLPCTDADHFNQGSFVTAAGYLERAGEELWCYQACDSHGCNTLGSTCESGLPQYAVDMNAASNRIFQLLCYFHGATGELYFATTYTLDSIRDTHYTGSTPAQTNGDRIDVKENAMVFGGYEGTFFYPGRVSEIGGSAGQDIPLPSLRMKMIRAGYTDYEYAKLAEAASSRSAVLNVLTGGGTPLITNTFTFTATETAFNSVRDSLASLIQGTARSWIFGRH